MSRFYFALILLLTSYGFKSFGQIKAKAISYKVDIDLEVFAPGYAEESDSETNICRFEVDTYYTDEVLKTVARIIERPGDFDLTIRQRYYLLKSKDEFNIDYVQSSVLLKRNQTVKSKPTGNTKTILGYKCAEHVFTDHRGIRMSVWVTDKLPRNICPSGNYSLKGTALEVTASNGVHYVATDFAEGQLDTTFFDLPTNFQTETLDLAGSAKGK
jgi:GLPGLI family protein